MKFKSSLAKFILISMVLTSSYQISNPVYAEAIADSWAKPSVTAMEKANLIPGALKDDADLTKNVSREEFAELITTYYNAVEKQTSIPSPSESKFTDTKNPLIVMANKLGIVGGYPDGSFKPYNNITRQEIAVMANQAEKQLTNIGQTKNVDKFSDKAKIADWAKESVGSLSNAGGIGGYPDGTFKPTNNMTKQEAIALVSNLAVKAGLIAKPTAPVVVAPPPVVGQTVEQAQALYTQTLAQYPVTKEGGIPKASVVKSFRIVQNGSPYNVILEEKSGTNVSVESEAGAPKVSAYARFYITDGTASVWSSKERGSTGYWWLNNLPTNQVKAVMLDDGQGNLTLVKIQ